MRDDRVVSPDVMEDDEPELSLRPRRLREFIGQARLKENLQIAIDAAIHRNDSLDHILFDGPPGLGKTTFATVPPQIPTSLPIKAGDLVGFENTTGNGFDGVGVAQMVSGASAVSWIPHLAEGQSRPADPLVGGTEIALNATVRYCAVPDLKGKKLAGAKAAARHRTCARTRHQRSDLQCGRLRVDHLNLTAAVGKTLTYGSSGDATQEDVGVCLVDHTGRPVTEQDFLDYISLANLIPGPNSTELVMHVGAHTGGRRGLWAAGAAFIGPAALITLVLAYIYKRWGSSPTAEGILAGIAPALPSYANVPAAAGFAPSSSMSKGFSLMYCGTPLNMATR